MKKMLTIPKGLIIAMSMIGTAYADNHNWTGFYAGANAGFGLNDVQLTSQQLGFTNPSDTCNMDSDFSTFSPGVQLGYLYQFSNSIVAGIESNTTFNTNQNDTMNCHSLFNSNVYDGFTFKNQMQTSIKGRLGWAQHWNKNFLPYVTAGASFAHVGLTYQNEGGDYYSTTTTSPGWLIGAGVEWAFMKHWSLRAEYYFADYGKVVNLEIPTIYGLNDPNGNANVNLSSNNFMVAINYWI
ncbi:MAG: outer membrane protein [Gammaproteobacteria bacterium]